MANHTHGQPPLPLYTLRQEPDLFSFISDKQLSRILPTLTFIALSVFWECIDRSKIWAQYLLHPSDDMLRRNRISKLECLRGITVYQLTGLAIATALTWTDPMLTFSGDEEYSISLWALRLRTLQSWIPGALSVVGLDALKIAKSVSDVFPALVSALQGGSYTHHPRVVSTAGREILVPAFMAWESDVATFLYYVGVPVFQFLIAFFIADTW